jgi:hypothetical protein
MAGNMPVGGIGVGVASTALAFILSQYCKISQGFSQFKPACELY